SVPTTTPSVSNVATNARSTMLIGFLGSGVAGTDSTGALYVPGSGFTFIDEGPNLGGSLQSDAVAEYKVVNSRQYQATVAYGSTGQNWLILGDAIAGSAASGGQAMAKPPNNLG